MYLLLLFDFSLNSILFWVSPDLFFYFSVFSENSFRKALDVDNKSVMLDIIDTAGQEEYKPIRDQYLKRGQGFLLVYAIDSMESFRAITPLYESILRAKDEDNFPMVLVVRNSCFHFHILQKSFQYNWMTTSASETHSFVWI
jgi:GTPase SAR1 family protein